MEFSFLVSFSVVVATKSLRFFLGGGGGGAGVMYESPSGTWGLPSSGPFPALALGKPVPLSEPLICPLCRMGITLISSHVVPVIA